MAVVVAMMWWPAKAEAQLDEAVPQVAVIVPLSGDLAPLGEQLLEAARLSARRHGIEVRAIDEGENAQQMREAVARAADKEGVVAAIGPVMRRHAVTAAGEAQRRQLPLVVYSAASGVEVQGPMVFRARLTPEAQSRQVAAFLAEDSAAQRIAIVAPRNSYGDSVVNALVDLLNRQGAKVTAMARYDSGTTDFGPTLEHLTGRRAYVGKGRSFPGVDGAGFVGLRRDGEVSFDTLVIADGDGVVARFVPFLPRHGIGTSATEGGASVQLVGLPGWRGDGLQRVWDHLRGAIFFDTFGGEVDGAEARRFVIEYRNQTDSEVTTAEAEIYDLVGLIATAVGSEDDDGRTRQEVVRNLGGGMSFEGVTGYWSFDQNGAPQRMLRGYEIVSGGRWAPLERGER